MFAGLYEHLWDAGSSCFGIAFCSPSPSSLLFLSLAFSFVNGF